MKNISIICARPPHFNPGMHSVDLAFFRFVKRHELSGSFSFYCLPDVNFDVFKLSDLPFNYKNSYKNINQIAPHHFTHWPTYEVAEYDNA